MVYIMSVHIYTLYILAQILIMAIEIFVPQCPAMAQNIVSRVYQQIFCIAQKGKKMSESSMRAHKVPYIGKKVTYVTKM